MAQWILVWRCANTALSVSVLTLTLMDVLQRRKWTLRDRFYWQATALLFFSIILSNIYGIAVNAPVYPVATAIGTVALVYFLLAIALASRPERERVAKPGDLPPDCPEDCVEHDHSQLVR